MANRTTLLDRHAIGGNVEGGRVSDENPVDCFSFLSVISLAVKQYMPQR
jgi:hypothetical protein